MSWLLVAFIPGLLMVATFGLGRLEAGLEGDTVSPEDINAFLEQAKADCAKPAAKTSDVQTYELLDDEDDIGYSTRVVDDSSRGLPTQVFIHRGSNKEYQPTRHVYRV